MKKGKAIPCLLAMAAIFMMMAVSCDTTDNGEGDSDPVQMEIETLTSQQQRNISPDVPTADAMQLAADNTAFAFDLYRQVREEADNIICSPYSISLALAMTWAGAAGDTEQQMADALNFTLSKTDLHPAFNLIDLELESRGEGAEGTDGEGFQLNIANAIWGQTGYSFLDTFLDVLAENYGAGLQLLDFETSAEDARIVINDWVSEQTQGRIEDLIPQGILTSLTRLVLTNAIYFNAAWDHPFEEEDTETGVFTLLDGAGVATDMMTQIQYYDYMQGEGYQALEIPYDGRELSMLILLPDEGAFSAFESALDADGIDGIIAELTYTFIDLAMPRFSFETKLDLKEVLVDMGMPDAFEWLTADFSGMDGTRNLFITDVLHKAFIAVDEAGTEAAAATAVVAAGGGIPGTPLEMTIDRPFIFLIRDLETQSVLFMGRVLNPEALI